MRREREVVTYFKLGVLFFLFLFFSFFYPFLFLPSGKLVYAVFLEEICFPLGEQMQLVL